jgi:hypothetical protein
MTDGNGEGRISHSDQSWSLVAIIVVTIFRLHLIDRRRVVNCGVIPKPDSDSDSDSVGVVKKSLSGFGVGVTKKKFLESVSESYERKIYMNKYHKMKYMY